MGHMGKVTELVEVEVEAKKKALQMITKIPLVETVGKG
jgi:hypothetical protein